jgi:hypothetical protein
MVRGARCLGLATTVHHIIASSQAPHLFWAEENLLSSCGPCNYSGGARVAAENGRQQIQRLHETIWQQAAEIDWLLARIAELEKPKPMPAIH